MSTRVKPTGIGLEKVVVGVVVRPSDRGQGSPFARAYGGGSRQHVAAGVDDVVPYAVRGSGDVRLREVGQGRAERRHQVLVAQGDTPAGLRSHTVSRD